MSFDAAVVDTFLHRQDQAFSVHELLELVETNGLMFQSWLDSGEYGKNFPGADLNISERQRWSVVENLSIAIPTHHFIVCQPERYPNLQISFEGDQWLGYYPLPHPTSRPSILEKEKICRSSVSGSTEYSLSSAEAVLFAEANGQRAISKILQNGDLAKMQVQERIWFARTLRANEATGEHVLLQGPDKV
jgi:hypothetical protein